MENVQGDYRSAFIDSMSASLTLGEGVLATAYRPVDIEADAASLTNAGLTMTGISTFTRPVPLPGNRTGEASGRFAFSIYDPAPDFRLFLSQQDHPEVVWIPQWQEHSNGAIRIEAIDYLLRNPAGHAALFTAFTGVRPDTDGSGNLAFETPTNRISLVQFGELKARYGDAAGDPAPHRFARLTAAVIRVESLATLRYTLDSGGFPFVEHESKVILDPNSTHGLILAFIE
jgi:hypothetical protein